MINPEGFGEELTLWEYIDFRYQKAVKAMNDIALEGGINLYYQGIVDTLYYLKEHYDFRNRR